MSIFLQTGQEIHLFDLLIRFVPVCGVLLLGVGLLFGGYVFWQGRKK